MDRSPPRRPDALRAILLAVGLVGLISTARAAEPIPLGKEAYLTPPKEIADALQAMQTDNRMPSNLSPDGKKFVVVQTEILPPLERLACPTVHLAELAFDPVATRSRDLWVRSAKGFDLFFHADKKTVPVKVPEKARVGNPVWSPDGKQLAFFAHYPDATYIYVADGETGESRKVTQTPVLATLATTFQWSRDGKKIMTVLRPDDGKRELPKPSAVATEPKVRVARDGRDPSRTYRYLLESPHDMQLLEYLVNGQLATVDVADGKVAKVGNPRLIRAINMAPDGERFRVTTVKKPFSYYFPFPRFGSLEEVWGADGKSFVVLADQNLRETELPAGVAAAPAAGAGSVNRGGGAGSRGRATGQPPAGANPPGDPTMPDPPGGVQDPPVDPNPIPDPNVDPNAPRRAAAPTDPDGKRDLNWRPDGAGLSFLQLAPANPKDEKEVRKDRVMLWVAPFGKTDVKTVYETPNRIASALYTEDAQWLFLTQTVENQRQITAIDLKDTKKTFTVYKQTGRTAEPPAPPMETDDEQQPGGRGGFNRGGAGGVSLLTRLGMAGLAFVRVSKAGDVYLTGSERPAGGEAPFAKPYLDKVSIATGKKERLFEGTGEMVESIEGVDGNDVTAVFTTRQKTDVIPDLYKTAVPKGATTKLTDNRDPCAWHHKLKVERIRVTRVDGFKFWVKVTMPPDGAKKLPAMFWIYPREYTDQASYDAGAGRTGATGGRFAAVSPRSMTMLTLLGYVLVEPDVPIVGPAGRMNDNYVSDLRNGLWAVIDELDKRGIIDRDRLACGGHSYGAFSTANAMAHTPFFKAGIAGDGNYNRTLTMMTFQTERRQLWDARETYLEMSPLLWANRINGALLMYHGMEDANVGTDPVNAEHLFMALDGLGKPASLYMYPYEAHGPIGRETTFDLWARWVGWLDKYVKNPKK